MTVTIGLAFLAGLASFLSPCVFSLVPAYVGYLSGRSAAAVRTGDKTDRFVTFTHGLAFVLGFSVIFILLGIAVSAVGSLLYDLQGWLGKIGGVVVMIFGFHMAGIFRIPFLEYDLRPRSRMDQGRSYISSLLMGVFFSAGWSPCVGPVLGAILTLALSGGNIGQGVRLLSAYSAGLAIPFLVAALAIGWITGFLKRYGRVLHIIEVVMGAILIVVGLMLFFGIFERLARFGYFVDFGL